MDNFEISAKDAAALWNKKEIKLLDVRGEDERILAKIEGVPTIDRKFADEVIAKWPKDTAIVLNCHHGIRSMDAVAYLKDKGFTNVKSLAGGIEAWSRDVDPSIPSY